MSTSRISGSMSAALSRIGFTDQLLLTPAEMALADRASIDAGVSGIDLMEAAGHAVANAVQRYWSIRPVLVLCGPGGNGGDGFAAARHLAVAGWQVRLASLCPVAALSGDAAHHASLWHGPVEGFSVSLLNDAQIVVDAIFGSGLSRSVDGTAGMMIEAMIQRASVICAVDVPSGMDDATGAVLGVAAPAAVTVTFFRKKPGHLLSPGKTLCGKLEVADIGTPESVFDAIKAEIGKTGERCQTWENGTALWESAYPWPHPEGHKYQRGHALILGGAKITGASRLTARAATRVGAGLVTLAAPKQVWAVYATALTGVMVRALRRDQAGQVNIDFADLLSDVRHNAIAIGPGVGVGDGTRGAVIGALSTRRAVVLDADALTSFAEEPAILFKAINGPCVLTPHEGEFARLFDVAGDKLTRARQAAKTSGAVVLLKGSDTVIAEPGGRAVINSNAPATLATGGSGDVLTGFVTGLLAQGLDPFRAACAATWLHGEVATAFGAGLIAEDIPDGLPDVLNRLLRIQTQQEGFG